jgi:hypothetical protein
MQTELGMDLYKRNSRVWRIFIIKGYVIHAYLGYNIIDIQKLMKEMSGTRNSVISEHSIYLQMS